MSYISETFYRGVYFQLGCDKYHGIFFKFDPISEKFLCKDINKSAAVATFEKNNEK